jgi:hypothetical protein
MEQRKQLMKQTNADIIAQTMVDVPSGKIISHYGESSVFVVYVKRHNGLKKIVFMGNGNQLPDVLDFYHSYAVYMNDRKYLCHRLLMQRPDEEMKVLMQNGKGEMRLNRNQPGRKRVDYQVGELSAMHNIPQSIISGLDTFAKKGNIINSQHLTKTRLISILLAVFLEKSETEKLKFLAAGDLALEKQKLLCGGFDIERSQKVAKHEESADDGLL